ncbi:hypothetical protein Aperf_G00000127023 [Anoplocephala perfoliata]
MECAPGAGEILAMSSPSPRSCAAVSIEVSSIEPVNSSAKMETVDDTEVGIQVSTAKLEMGASSSGCRSSRISVEDIKESEKSSTPVNGSLLQTEWNISASLSGRRGSRMSVELPQTDSPQGTELPVDVDEQAVGSSPCLSESKDGQLSSQSLVADSLMPPIGRRLFAVVAYHGDDSPIVESSAQHAQVVASASARFALQVADPVNSRLYPVSEVSSVVDEALSDGSVTDSAI